MDLESEINAFIHSFIHLFINIDTKSPAVYEQLAITDVRILHSKWTVGDIRAQVTAM